MVTSTCGDYKEEEHLRILVCLLSQWKERFRRAPVKIYESEILDCEDEENANIKTTKSSLEFAIHIRTFLAVSAVVCI